MIGNPQIRTEIPLSDSRDQLYVPDFADTNLSDFGVDVKMSPLDPSSQELETLFRQVPATTDGVFGGTHNRRGQ